MQWRGVNSENGSMYSMYYVCRCSVGIGVLVCWLIAGFVHAPRARQYGDINAPSH